jgi:hypothetical protein
VAAIDRFAIALGRGVVAGAAATAAMTISSTAEMKLRRRPPSAAPATVAAKLLRVKPQRDGAGRFATVAHATTGVALGTVRGMLALIGLGDRPAAGAFFAVAWAPDLIAVPLAGAAPPPWRWGAGELAISGLHHVVYALAGERVYRELGRDA